MFFEPDADFIKSKKDNLFLKFLPIFLPYRKEIKYSILASAILLFFGIITSFYYKYLFDTAIYSSSNYTLNTISFGMCFVVLVQAIIGAVRYILLSHFSFKADLQLNLSYIEHILNLPISFFEGYKTGEIMSRLEDLEKVKRTLYEVVITGIMDALMFLISAPILYIINKKLFFISFLISLLISVIAFIFSKFFKSFYSKSMSQNAEVSGYLFESLNGIQTVKALNAQPIVYDKYEIKKMVANKTDWTVNNLHIFHGCISSILNMLSGIIVYWVGVNDIILGTMSFGALISYNSLLSYFTGPIFRLVNVQNNIQKSIVAAERVGEILELEKEQDENKNYLILDKIKGSIKFDNISFSYGGRRPIFNNLCFEIKRCSWTAFVGPSGCGKTTLIKLILKFYDVQEGSILLDNYDIKDIDTRFLRNCIGYVPQDIFLLSGTIADNISLQNQSARMEDIINAAKKAGADEFIQKLPDKYETMLGEHGGGLSGGEKQRLALARALLGKPNLLILDEATSNLDAISEMEIHNIIKKLRKENVTVIVIAHRLSTVRNCDNIFVIKDGKIQQEGNHDKLIKQDGLYKDMWMEMQN